MTRLSDVIIKTFREDSDGPVDWLPEYEGTIDEIITAFPNPETATKQLDLLANAMVEAFRASEIPTILNPLMRNPSQRVRDAGDADVLSHWLLTKADKARRVYEDHQLADRCASGAELTERLMELYSGWGIVQDYEDVASHFVAAVGGMDTSQPAVLKVLAELRELERLDLVS